MFGRLRQQEAVLTPSVWGIQLLWTVQSHFFYFSDDLCELFGLNLLLLRHGPQQLLLKVSSLLPNDSNKITVIRPLRVRWRHLCHISIVNIVLAFRSSCLNSHLSLWMRGFGFPWPAVSQCHNLKKAPCQSSPLIGRPPVVVNGQTASSLKNGSFLSDGRIVVWK